MSGEHWLDHQVAEELADSVLTVTRSDLGYSFGQRFGNRLRAPVTLAQRARPVPVLGEVDELEVARERPRDLFGPIDRPRRHQKSGATIVLIAVAGGDHCAPELFDGCEHLAAAVLGEHLPKQVDRKSTRLNSSHQIISYAVFCLKKK